jgi:dethiobiotin synthetase
VISLPGLFVVGTDTGVGKTHVAVGIARSLASDGRQAGVVKPVATGLDEGDGLGADGRRLMAAASVPGAPRIPAERIVPISYAEPLAPPVAARRCGRPLERAAVEKALDTALAWWSERADVVVVEGIGGLLTPVAEGTTVADLAVWLDYPLVIVARRELGTLNHTLLTVEAARHRGLRIVGLVLNSAAPIGDDGALAAATNAGELARLLEGIAVLAEIPYGADPGEAGPADIFGGLDWFSRALPPRWRPPGSTSSSVWNGCVHARS